MSAPSLPAELAAALAALALPAVQRQRLEALLRQRLENQDQQMQAAIDKALELVPALLRGTVRRVLDL